MKVLVSIINETGEAAMMVEYIAMLCLLQSEMGQYSAAEVAASCMLLSRLLVNKGRRVVGEGLWIFFFFCVSV